MTDRITCTECRHYTGTHCMRPIEAGLHAYQGRAEIGPAFAALPQWCPVGARK